ncbi:hypothetical protein BH18ACT4_BH18ACT4_00350 [soil metagenome]
MLAAQRLLEKVRAFVRDDLNDEERGLFAALVAPGVARAYGEAEAAGFGLTEWRPDALPSSLVDALRNEGIQVSGL